MTFNEVEVEFSVSLQGIYAAQHCAASTSLGCEDHVVCQVALSILMTAAALLAQAWPGLVGPEMYSQMAKKTPSRISSYNFANFSNNTNTLTHTHTRKADEKVKANGRAKETNREGGRG